MTYRIVDDLNITRMKKMFGMFATNFKKITAFEVITQGTAKHVITLDRYKVLHPFLEDQIFEDAMVYIAVQLLNISSDCQATIIL